MSDPIAYDQANALQKVIRGFAASGPGAWLFARALPRIDRPVNRMTRGRYTLASLVSGIPVVMLTTTGAKSGQPRTVPVLGIPADGDRRSRIWQEGLRVYPGFGQYERRAAHRNISVFVLEPS